MAIKYEKLVTQSLAKQISENIRDAILQGRLKVDERLPTEEELAQRFSVSRPTIREALKRLAAQNLIRSQRGPTGGTFVKKPSREELSSALTNAATLMVTLGEFDLAAIVEARREMEQLCLKLAVQRRTPEQLAIMQEELDNQRSEISDEAFCASDIRFHRAIVDGCGNPILQFNMYTVIEALQPLTNMVANRFRDRQQIVELHQQLYDAIEAQQIEVASTTLDQLIEYLRDQYAKALAWQQQKNPPSPG
ncbi:FadR/GntR family transcriptional regulator [Marinobacterium arenosum]|uniref:FadR/GntR family transcriptional regulator n=1 Tax=Marinobacterium arenosum TaxID=2862496 RepID=UPI001C93F557|nr:FadR/GntR family transcriptional regulator [Marinobacterium arenosum]MBY4675596.1 FadR family transcriptional regulator [Marinobacterium arenosum]